MTNPKDPAASLPAELIASVKPAATNLGIDLPGIAAFVPCIDVAMPIRMLAYEIGRTIARQNIFLRNGQVGTVCTKTGDWLKMTAKRFSGWLEEFATFRSSSGRRHRESLTPEDAGIILETDIFLECLNPLVSIHLMRLPVRRSSKKWDVEFLEPGYDSRSQIYTLETITYPMTWTVNESIQYLDRHGKDYPWTWPNDISRPLNENRSWSVQIAVMIGCYCRAFFPPGTAKPMLTIVGNQPGTGKSTLVAMALIPVFGHASAGKMPRNDDEMNKELETIARTQSPYLFLDDIGESIHSVALNRFITASSHAGREMGGNDKLFRVPQLTQVFCTGNDIKLSADLMRRTLAMELHLATEIRGRKYDRAITPAYLSKPETRQSMLAALCGVVRGTLDLYGGTDGDNIVRIDGLESFEDYTSTISTIVQVSGYTDPLVSPELASSGAEDDDEMRLLLVTIATATEEDTEYDRNSMVEAARTAGLLEGLVGLAGDKELDSKMSKRWGRQLQKWRGRQLVDGRGRRFVFSHRHQKTGKKYPLTFLKLKGN
jgi:hypothetical protein